MAEIKVEIPDELNEKAKKLDLDVSKLVSKNLIEEITKRAAMESITSKSELTERDALELGKKAKKGRHEELKKKGLI